MSISFRSALALTASAALLLTGCAQISAGEAQRDPGYNPDEVNIALLDTGNYPTTPAAPLGNADNPQRGRVIEARRMYENAIFPFQVDPALANLQPRYTRPFTNAKNAALALENKALEGPINDHNWVAGLSITGNDDKKPVYDRYLQNAVLLFNTPADATAAATQMAEASNNKEDPFSRTPYSVSPQSIPRYSDASARTYTVAITGDNPTTSYHVVSYLAHGPYVLSQDVVTKTSVDASAELVAKTLDQQIPLIDAYKPTFADGLAALPRDPTGLLARMRFPDDKNAVVQNGAYGPHGALIFQTDQAWAQQLFTETGVDFYADLDDSLIRARDNAGATKVLDTYFSRMGGAGWNEVDGVHGLPPARCMQQTAGDADQRVNTWCMLVHDNIVLQAMSNQDLDARQRLSADYLMLTAE
ncbi:hypothetical protein MINS_28700 [Mycolicibacterium insubricum]|mgnify:CR=1 FL=1|jgi:hypothetical protein|uniref:Uncharacterized protein n=1 Tax=Mycolicibacterium insubricum TaxID=444597 RepID=A0A1X0DN66_9MYCO|nr:hypothetical protein [Mycolicibacterium insubricum]MCB9441832.1 hypothetical protein [Mycolicibacterium sp.]MCV7082162.1 hypothetical protein [Mycolicibacterium insubricum]ORA73851.1 hypothetical protein BST26_01375 [Mycolicibacterium insubricum]BBZ67441.1 hypothetical protein MINS_28700 [Mycolicibacterium insubricum]